MNIYARLAIGSRKDPVEQAIRGDLIQPPEEDYQFTVSDSLLTVNCGELTVYGWSNAATNQDIPLNKHQITFHLARGLIRSRVYP